MHKYTPMQLYCQKNRKERGICEKCNKCYNKNQKGAMETFIGHLKL